MLQISIMLRNRKVCVLISVMMGALHFTAYGDISCKESAGLSSEMRSSLLNNRLDDLLRMRCKGLDDGRVLFVACRKDVSAFFADRKADPYS